MGNLYLNCTGWIAPGLDALEVERSPLPSPCTLDPVMDVPGLVTHGAGQGPFAP